MKKVDECNRVRELRFKEDTSIREIARKTGFHRTTIRKIISATTLSEYTRKNPPNRPKLGQFLGIIEEIVKNDKNIPKKQRHTAVKVFERLRDEHGYRGGYTQVREYVAEVKNLIKEAYVPLEFGPGVAQADWGESLVWHEGRLVKAHMFVMSLPYSGDRFVACFPRERMEFFLEGHRLAFRYFKGVPRRIIYDNLKTAVVKVGKRHNRDLNETFKKFCELCLFEPAFCNVARGNEKGHVENSVGWARRNFFVPQPILTDWTSFNDELAGKCLERRLKRLRGKEKTIGKLLEEERQHLLPIPPEGMIDPPKPRKVNSLCLVRYDTNDYSVPCQYAHHDVGLRADVCSIRIYYQDRLIAEHRRSYKREQDIYEPWHYLALIERKPRALDYGAPMKRLELDECFGILRRRLEAIDENGEGTKDYIRVLRLLEKHSLQNLTRAVKRALELGVEDPEAIKNIVLCPPEKTPSPLDLSGRNHLAAYRISPPQLSHYSKLAGAL